MKSLMFKVIILALGISTLAMAEATTKDPTPAQCKAAVAANTKTYTPNKHESEYEILIQLRLHTFDLALFDNSQDLGLFVSPQDSGPVKKETKAEMKLRLKDEKTRAAYAKNKIAILNGLRKKAGLKKLEPSDIEWEPEIVYETNPALEALAQDLSEGKSEINPLLQRCQEIKIQKAIDNAGRDSLKEMVTQANLEAAKAKGGAKGSVTVPVAAAGESVTIPAQPQQRVD